MVNFKIPKRFLRRRSFHFLSLSLNEFLRIGIINLVRTQNFPKNWTYVCVRITEGGEGGNVELCIVFYAKDTFIIYVFHDNNLMKVCKSKKYPICSITAP